MKLSVSNIGWTEEQDEQVYIWMKKYGFSGLEIAPTRIFPKEPYNHKEEAGIWSLRLREQYGFVVSSMQSIWFGREEKLFGTKEERRVLVDYTKKAIDFAAAIGCKNLVFGCPRNRNIPEGVDSKVGIAFFREIGDYAAEKQTVIGIEANPPIYNTNYMNDTESALNLIESVDSPGFKLNLDLGTMIQNEENIPILRGKVKLINHIHISEPGLKPIEQRENHQELKQLLVEEDYQNWISIEMGKTDDIAKLEKAMLYIEGEFN